MADNLDAGAVVQEMRKLREELWERDRHQQEKWNEAIEALGKIEQLSGVAGLLDEFCEDVRFRLGRVDETLVTGSPLSGQSVNSPSPARR